ncbi:MAG: FAD-dependent oxidoreductase, partial [Pseudomonadota bacterium]
VMYERRERAGGHAHTVQVDYDGRSIPVDIGFIVFNERNYPNFVALLRHLGVQSKRANMSFGISRGDGALEWASSNGISSFFAQRRNMVSPSFLAMTRDMFRFNRLALKDYQANLLGERSLGAYLSDRRFSAAFQNNYIVPMGAAIWSTPHASILDFPAESFIRFFKNHHLLTLFPPSWQTVVGGSRSYVSRLIAPFQSGIRYGCGVQRIFKRNGQVIVRDDKGHEDRFDHVVLASHSDQSLGMIDDPSPDQRRLLSAIPYRNNDVYLHRDPTLMPKREKVWSAWNYIEAQTGRGSEKGVSVSYSMNLLQGIDKKYPLFVSLNPARPPREDLTFKKTRFAHPQYDANALKAQEQLDLIQGRDNLWYCGAWCGYGFHEDGLASGLAVAERLGGRVPWRDYAKDPVPQLEAAE